MIDLANIRELIPEAIFEPRYFSTNNVLKRVLSADDSVQLEATAAKQLRKACDDFKDLGLTPVFWDLYRKREVQLQLLTFNSDPRYVLGADESNHVKGLAVDMTLAYPSGVYLDMGTDFDDFSDRAHADTQSITPEQHSNRELMAGVMAEYGFAQLPTEWWHFDYTQKI